MNCSRVMHCQSRELLDALGVLIVEGEHPGSSYYAAELRNDIEEANGVAQSLGLPFRFKSYVELQDKTPIDKTAMPKLLQP